jgi:hypothetical protein
MADQDVAAQALGAARGLAIVRASSCGFAASRKGAPHWSGLVLRRYLTNVCQSCATPVIAVMRQGLNETGFVEGRLLSTTMSLLSTTPQPSFDCPRGGIARYSLQRKICLPPVSLTDVQISLANCR